MKRTVISEILKEKDLKKLEGEKVLIKGWVRAFRSNRFIQINDGSCLSTIQAVIEYEKFDEDHEEGVSYNEFIDFIFPANPDQDAHIKLKLE